MIGIINYNTGNLKSVANALNKLNQSYKIISTPAEIKSVSKIILPGVGSAGFAMKELKKLGFADLIKKTQKPTLGICLGMQILAEFSEEENTKCLGIIKGKIKKFDNRFQKVPQIGWNKIEFSYSNNPLLEGIKSDEYFYFVNSYYFIAPAKNTIAKTSYEVNFSSIVYKDRFFGVQFHPEKSGEAGLKLLNNFCTLC